MAFVALQPGVPHCQYRVRIREIKSYPVPGVLFQLHVEAKFGSDEVAFSRLEYTERRALYVLKHQAQ